MQASSHTSFPELRTIYTLLTLPVSRESDLKYLTRTTVSSSIADQVHVPEQTAKSHLESLVGVGVLQETSNGEVTQYSVDPDHTKQQSISEQLKEHDQEALIPIREEMEMLLETWRSEYDVDSPECLRDCAEQQITPSLAQEFQKVAGDWELVEYRLNLVKRAVEQA